MQRSLDITIHHPQTKRNQLKISLQTSQDVTNHPSSINKINSTFLCQKSLQCKHLWTEPSIVHKQIYLPIIKYTYVTKYVNFIYSIKIYQAVLHGNTFLFLSKAFPTTNFESRIFDLNDAPKSIIHNQVEIHLPRALPLATLAIKSSYPL